MRLNIAMDEELVKKIDEMASKCFVSRSAYISFAVSQKLQQDALMSKFPELLTSMKTAVDMKITSESASTAVGGGLIAEGKKG